MLFKKSSNKKIIEMSKQEWLEIGKKANWIKSSATVIFNNTTMDEMFSPVKNAINLIYAEKPLDPTLDNTDNLYLNEKIIALSNSLKVYEQVKVKIHTDISNSLKIVNDAFTQILLEMESTFPDKFNRDTQEAIYLRVDSFTENQL